ncbi:hypothetical protein DS2_18795 [Catenovulum agarivorans DS-2]|uniref:PEP-CTERM protein-sorting domain-containing protein n=1 Tax=Catenovulum agarivorans DS-2 TaxID=1328313 RepID=W7Q5V4_9ALTE|nr:hypothetical protein [Catenovulum agarivorans]EWH08154.1 hypothetical protein DS2_18795 [Catenovulum agarivorans DS-2]
MIKRIQCILVATIFISFSQLASATLISGQIDNSDHLAVDVTGGFYYDLFEVTAGSTTDIDFDVTSDGWGIWLAWGDMSLPNWPIGSDTPYNDMSYGVGNGSTTSTGIFSPVFTGEIFQIIVTTQAYNPTLAGAYELEISGDFSIQQINSVPEPNLTWLLAIMLMLGGRKYALRYC